jgi:hypothetical protein
MGLACGYSKPANMPVQPGTIPSITQISPVSQTAGSAAFTLTVDGTSFAGGAAINFNGAAQVTTHSSATELKATIPASAIMNTGTVPVTVTNPGTPGGLYGGGTQAETSAPMNFTID